MRQVVKLFTPKEALHLLRTHITGYLMVFASTGAPQLNKKSEDYWTGDIVDKRAWNILLNDVMAKDFEDHVPKVKSVTVF